MNDEREIVHRILGGDSQAFRRLVQDYQKLVFHIVIKMIVNKTDQEEIAQEIFIKVFEKLKTFEFKSKLSTWIAKIACNTCLNYLQKRKIARYHDEPPYWESQSVLTTMAAVDDSAIHPDELLITNQRNRILKHAIASLPVQQKTILSLYHLEEMSYKEIGEIMGLPEGTVKSYLFRARKMLKDLLLEKYQKEELCK